MHAGLQLSHVIILGVIGLSLIVLGTSLVLLGNAMIRRARRRAAQPAPAAAVAPPRRRAQAGPRGYGFGTRVHR